MDLQQLKGINAKFLTTYVKGVPFINGIKVCERSTFSVKNGIQMVKRLLLDPQAEHPPKQNFVKYPPGLKADAFCLCLRYEQDFRIHASVNKFEHSVP